MAKFICNVCNTPCILEDGTNLATAAACPHNAGAANWELDEHSINPAIDLAERVRAECIRLNQYQTDRRKELDTRYNNEVRQILDRLRNLDDKTANLESFHRGNAKQIRKVSDRLAALEAGPLSIDLQRLKERITTVANRLYALQTRLATACFEENH